jgi:hypothetical protein
LKKKIYSITVDNAEENDVALSQLKPWFPMRCCAHIINLMVQDGLGEIEEIVDCVRDGIKYLVASEGRLMQFSKIAKNLQLSSKKLLLDVLTRWNSTYLMLTTAYEFRKVFLRYGHIDQQFTWVLSLEDWAKVESVCELLKVFNPVIKTESESGYPKASLVFYEICNMKNLLTQKCSDQNDYIRFMAQKMKAKIDKYWDEFYLFLAVATILDPRFKIKLIEYWLFSIYKGGAETKKNIECVQGFLTTIYNAYVNNHSSNLVEHNLVSNAQNCSSSNCPISAVDQGGLQPFVTYLKSVETVHQPVKSELEIYLEEGVNLYDVRLKFSALDWWKANTSKYPILSKVAKDILSTLISTVTLESTFSAGGGVIDPYRASLSTKTVQMLLCGADWVGSMHGFKKKSAVSLFLFFFPNCVCQFNFAFTLY